MKEKWKILFILLIVIVLITLVIVFIINIPTEKEDRNIELNTDQMTTLLKHASTDLTKSASLKEGSISNDSMISFAASYMMVNNELQYYITYDYDNNIIIAQKDKIEEIVNYLFDKKINYNLVSYKFENKNIYIPLLYHGGDMQVYKFNREEYDNKTDTYVMYIDVLETGYNRLEELSDPSTIDYDPDEVMSTMMFKYRIVDGRKVLLAFNIVSNW